MGSSERGKREGSIIIIGIDVGVDRKVTELERRRYILISNLGYERLIHYESILCINRIKEYIG